MLLITNRFQSGAAEIVQQGEGEEIIYSDLNIEQLKAIPPTALHRNVDLAVISADEQGGSLTVLNADGAC